MTAAEHGMVDRVQLLLNNGANIDDHDKVCFHFHFARFQLHVFGLSVYVFSHQHQ